MALSLYNRLRRGIEAMFHADTPDGDLTQIGGDFDLWSDLEARRFRYALGWASYQNTVYRDLHQWALELRRDTGLYKYIRSIYNATYRLTEFHVTHIHGGRLDPEAGDGTETLSKLPILTENESIRPAIAQLWRDSRWQVRKAGWVRQGAICGDVGLKIIENRRDGRITMEVVHAKHLKWVDLDDIGNVQGYIIEKRVPDPRRQMPEPGQRIQENPQHGTVIYEERCYRQGEERIVWETYLVDGVNARPYDWTGQGEVWTAPYGFVPLVLTQHIDMGLKFGLSEIHAVWPKIREADDQASTLHDQIRKAVRPAWFYSGINGKRLFTGTPETTSSELDSTDTSDRDKIFAVIANDPEARAIPLVFPLQIKETLEVLKEQVDEVERDYPELRFDRMRSQGSFPSGEALRIARQPASTKIEERRATYDSDLVKAQMMGIAIGGHVYGETRDSRLEAFASFGLDSYRAGQLDHSIGDRPVFAVDIMEEAAERQAQYIAIRSGNEAGLPRRKVLLEAGYSEFAIDEMMQMDQEDVAAEIKRMQARQAAVGEAETIDPDDMDTVDSVFDEDVA